MKKLLCIAALSVMVSACAKSSDAPAASTAQLPTAQIAPSQSVSTDPDNQKGYSCVYDKQVLGLQEYQNQYTCTALDGTTCGASHTIVSPNSMANCVGTYCTVSTNCVGLGLSEALILMEDAK